MKYVSVYTLHGAGRITANHINGIANVFNDPSAKSEDRLAYRVIPEIDNRTTLLRIYNNVIYVLINLHWVISYAKNKI